MSHEGIRFVSKEEDDRQSEENRPLPRAAMTPEKVRVLLTEGKGLEIDWADGHKSAWSFGWLREGCPCATCIDQRKTEDRKPGEPKRKPAQLLPMYEAPVKAMSVHPVGRYAIEFQWSDGHRAGIYSWEYLRRNCQCGECRFAAAKVAGTPN